MFYISDDYGKTWIFVVAISWMSPEFERLKMYYEKAGYATTYK